MSASKRDKQPQGQHDSGVEKPFRGVGGLLRSSAVVSLFTMLSRVLGLLRDIVLAQVIGASALADAFFVAFKIPNFFRRLFAEGAFAQAFVPVLGEYREKGSQAAVSALVARVYASLGGVLLFFTGLVVVAAPVFAALFAPSWWWQGSAQFAVVADLLRITFPYLLFISLVGVAGGILNSYDRFAVPAFTPVLLNLVLILAALFATPYFNEPVYALAWGVFAAGVVQFVFQLPFLKRIDMLPRPVWDWRDSGVKKILGLMGPAIFGVSVSQINLLLDTVLATFLPAGSVSWLYYADRLAELPLGVFAIAIAVVILPNLSRHHSADSQEQFSATLDWALRMVLLIAVPAAVALILLAEPILAALFYYGEVMQPRDIAMAAFSLRAYALGLVFFMLIKVLAPGFYARQDMRTPVRIGVIAMGANMVLNLILVLALHHALRLGHAGLALATALSAALNMALLLRGLRRADIFTPSLGWWRFTAQLGCAVVFMAGVAVWLATYWQLFDQPQWFAWGVWERIWRLLCVCLSAGLAYLMVLVGLGLRKSDLSGPAAAVSRQ